MTIGAIVLPLLALAVCGGGAWFAWRLVSAAEFREGERSSSDSGESGTAADKLGAGRPADAAGVEHHDPSQAHAERSGVQLAGFVIATAAIAIGLGGIGYVLAVALGFEPMWLLAGYALFLALVGGAALVWRRNRARREAGG